MKVKSSLKKLTFLKLIFRKAQKSLKSQVKKLQTQIQLNSDLKGASLRFKNLAKKIEGKLQAL